MSAPTPSNNGVAIGHLVYVIFSGSGTLKQSLNSYGTFFDTEVDDDSLLCLVVDPRFSHADVTRYIVELGGAIYVSPPEPPA